MTYKFHFERKEVNQNHFGNRGFTNYEKSDPEHDHQISETIGENFIQKSSFSSVRLANGTLPQYPIQDLKTCEYLILKEEEFDSVGPQRLDFSQLLHLKVLHIE